LLNFFRILPVRGGSVKQRAASRFSPLQRPAVVDRRAPSRLAVHSASRSATIIGLAFVASRVLGLLREVILGYRFGTSSEYDAYVSAFRVPDLLFMVVMAGAFGSAFIPVFGGFLAKGEDEKAWSLASAVITMSAVITVAVGFIIFIFAGPIMRYLVAPDLPADVQPVAANTMRILLLSPVLLGLAIAAKGILEAQDQFTLPAIAPIFYNAAIIVAAIVLAPTWGVKGVAAGVVVGAGLHLATQVPGLLASGMEFRPNLSTHVEGLREVGRLLLPRVIGLAAFQLNFVAVTHLASGAGEGRVSALNYAWQLMMLPHGVIALSISTVIFPAMARQYQQGDMSQVRKTFTQALEPLLFLTIPASVGLFELRTAIPQTIFQLGAFNAQSTELVSSALAFLALGLVWYALVEVLARIYYAMQDTRTPVIAGVIIIVLNIILGAALVGPLGHVGLAIGLSASTGVEALILFFLLRRKIGGLDPSFGDWIARVMGATAAMAVMAEIVRPRLERATAVPGSSRILHVMMLGYATALIGGTYLVAAHLLNIPQMAQGVGMAKRRLPAPLAKILP
jgi:putative peptidoglycan lipid II flippase